MKCILEDTGGVGACQVFYHLHPSFLLDVGDIYRKIEYEGGDIVISDDHMVYMAPSSTVEGIVFPVLPPQTEANFLVAANVVEGDLIIVEDDETGELVATVVKENKPSDEDTYYAPLVKGGLLFVDNVLASSYVTFPGPSEGVFLDAVNEDDTAHFVLNAVFGGFLHNLFQRGDIDTTEFWGKKRDDDDYIRWETEGFGRIAQEFNLTFTSIVVAQFSNLTLTAGEAIEFEGAVRAAVGEGASFTDAQMAALYMEAVNGAILI